MPRALRPLFPLVALAAAIFTAACTQVSREQVLSWREAVVAAREQSSATFEVVNTLVREEQFKRVEFLNRIDEAAFTPALDSKSVARWMSSLDALTTYAAAIDRLLAPELPAGVAESLRRTGEQLAVTADADLLRSDRELSNAIGSLGKLLTAAAAQSSARQIMLETDPAVTALLMRMADMLITQLRKADGTVAEAGVLVTITDLWDNRLTLIQLAFAKETSPQTRLAVARQYIEALDRKNASIESIRTLRISLLQLASSHTAAAQGRVTDLQTTINSIREQVATLRRVLQDIHPTTPAPSH